MTHIPVLQKEVLECLVPRQNENFVDATIGAGGHTAAILEKTAPKGKILGVEINRDILKITKLKLAKEHFEKRVILANGSYVNLEKIVKKYKFAKGLKGIIFDFGISSWHLEKSGKGFSFQKNELLDMRFGSGASLTAEEIINKWQQEKIEKILNKFGEERFAEKIAEKIIEERKITPIKTTFQLASIVKEAIPKKYWQKNINPATRSFQAFRIAVNQELENIKNGLTQAFNVLEKGGRIAAISFHSLEDRIVKNFFREKMENNLMEILTKKPIIPSNEEIKANHRSRSAKLRSAIKL